MFVVPVGVALVFSVMCVANVLVDAAARLLTMVVIVFLRVRIVLRCIGLRAVLHNVASSGHLENLYPP